MNGEAELSEEIRRLTRETEYLRELAEENADLVYNSEEDSAADSYFRSYGLVKKDFSARLVKSFQGNDYVFVRHWKCRFGFSEYPEVTISVEYDTTHTFSPDHEIKKKECPVSNLSLSIISSDKDDDLSETGPLFSSCLSQQDFQILFESIPGFLQQFYDRKLSLINMKTLLTEDSYEVFTQDDGTIKIVFTEKDNELLTLVWRILLRDDLKYASKYVVQFTELGKSKARDVFFPDELLDGEDYDFWTPKYCLEMISKMISLKDTCSDSVKNDSINRKNANAPFEEVISQNNRRKNGQPQNSWRRKPQKQTNKSTRPGRSKR